MYTAKLSLSVENVDDVLAVASFLQMQEVISACNTLRALSGPAEPSPSQEGTSVAGTVLPPPPFFFPFFCYCSCRYLVLAKKPAKHLLVPLAHQLQNT